jgi:NADH:ubiquinone oxidoreductase subunit
VCSFYPMKVADLPGLHRKCPAFAGPWTGATDIPFSWSASLSHYTEKRPSPEDLPPWI